MPKNRTFFGESAETTRQPLPAIPTPRLRESRENLQPTGERGAIRTDRNLAPTRHHPRRRAAPTGLNRANASASVVASAAVDVDGLAGDEAAVVADQKEAGGGDLVHVPLTTQWNAGGARHTPLVPLGIVATSIDAAG